MNIIKKLFYKRKGGDVVCEDKVGSDMIFTHN